MFEHMLRQFAWAQIRLAGATNSERRRGQGTVEYIGMVVMVTLLIAAVAVLGKSWAPDIGSGMKRALSAAIKKLSGGLT